VAGIALAYKPDELVGRKVVIVANLAPRKLRGVESQGMILAASRDGDIPVLVAPIDDVPPGTRLK
jgi:methionyl-tRNA synthetase